MFRAKDAMSQNIISVDEETPIYEAMKVLIEKNITGLPVVDKDKKLVGIVSEKDMLKLLYNAQPSDENVGSFMTRQVTFFDEEDDLVKICDCLIDNHFRRVPILSGDKLVGVVSRKDIIRFIINIRERRS